MVGWRRRQSSSPATTTSPTAKTLTLSAITTGMRPPDSRCLIPATKWSAPPATSIARRPPRRLTRTTTNKDRLKHYRPLPHPGEGFFLARTVYPAAMSLAYIPPWEAPRTDLESTDHSLSRRLSLRPDPYRCQATITSRAMKITTSGLSLVIARRACAPPGPATRRVGVHPQRLPPPQDRTSAVMHAGSAVADEDQSPSYRG